MTSIERLSSLRRLEINGGRVVSDTSCKLLLNPTDAGYTDAQLDDYGGSKRRDYPWRPGTRLDLRARFSHPEDKMLGTAGFGFWNAPFGDPTIRRPALPQATWFFFASRPSDLPFPEAGPGRGWFAGTMDVATPWTCILAPLALPILAMNNVVSIRRRTWPAIRRRLKISYAPVGLSMVEWHQYQLEWQPDGCRFLVDDTLILQTDRGPSGPLGFVCWLDNQYLAATPKGRFRWGALPIGQQQWIEISSLRLESTIEPPDTRF
ncbi:MAG: family 16 glycosylhydrolase [Chloroflexota bacterium]|nr:MAG: family 16 glycosylhydrolase [Chloroflexota bacterium]